MTCTDPRLTVRFEILGRDTDRIKSYRIDSAFLTSTDGFEFVLYDEDRSKIQGLEMEPVELLLSGSTVSGAQQLLGRIDITEIGGDGSAVTCRGRDYIADLVECHCDPDRKITKDMTLAYAMSYVAAPVGIVYVIGNGDLKTRNIRTGKSPSGGAHKEVGEAKLEEIKPQPGQGIYEFCNRLAARNGATIQPGTARNELVLAAPDYDQAPLYSIRRSSDNIRGRRNNIVQARAVRNYGSFPTYVLFQGKMVGGSGKSGALQKDLGPQRDGPDKNHTLAFLDWDPAKGKDAGKKNAKKAAGGGGGSKRTQLEQKWEMGQYAAQNATSLEFLNIAMNLIIEGRVQLETGVPNGGRLYRLMYQKDSEAKNQEQITRLANRAASERLKETLTYTVTLKGHEDPETGALYGVNTIIDVQDEITGVYEPLWIARRTFTYQPGQGAQTELECWRKHAFQV